MEEKSIHFALVKKFRIARKYVFSFCGSFFTKGEEKKEWVLLLSGH